MAALNIDAGQLGSLVIGLFITYCIAQFFMEPLVDKYGYKLLAIASFTITTPGMFVLAFAPSFSIALLHMYFDGY